MASKSESENGAANRNGQERNRAADAYQAARDRTSTAFASARSRAADVSRQAADQVAIYPVGAVIGGLAVGAVLAYLLPATRREAELLGSTGKRLTDAAREAAQRGVDAGKEQIEEIRSRAAQKVGEAVVEAVGGGSNSKD